ncbi:hypothetical protein [Spiroplasma endosymbiont of Crioceris asparagi]|uniref:hypothetical protein n=1 Tax=Spiroplasma endosymbiont of Crioceris asparagi TaxID=3066286 RepID=UPI0030D55423
MLSKEKEKLVNQIVSEALFELFSITEEEVTVELFQQFLTNKYFLEHYMVTKNNYKLEDVIDSLDKAPKDSFRELISKSKNKPNTEQPRQLEKLDTNSPKTFGEIINVAKKNAKILEENSFTKPTSEEEELILRIAEERGQNKYDAEILRELIIARQKKKRQGTNVNNYFDEVKDKKNNYLKNKNS